MTIQLRGGHTANDPRLGRLPERDPRNQLYPIRALVDDKPPLRGRGWVLHPSRFLNQRNHPRCVGYSRAHDLASQPRPVPATSALADQLYKHAQLLDQWEGEDYGGSSVLGGAKAALALGYIGEYRWAGEQGADWTDDVLRALSHVGGVVLGTDWTSGMMDPTPGGLVQPLGSVDGGHAYYARGFVTSRQAKRLRLGIGEPVRSEPLIYGPNSWGLNWGRQGEWCMWADDLATLGAGLSGWPGDACLAVSHFRAP